MEGIRGGKRGITESLKGSSMAIREEKKRIRKERRKEGRMFIYLYLSHYTSNSGYFYVKLKELSERTQRRQI
ncbi:Hypothetical predicted protein [Octopus vulgaris]|uniref:Uncharacterized protein n=1 Tax=Octopus vulgaris TaxID=6645 RepID=A0AA36F1C7_OCTVU|nr:Hypothetical predicted protein [Octopus vulgaris]